MSNVHTASDLKTISNDGRAESGVSATAGNHYTENDSFPPPGDWLGKSMEENLRLQRAWHEAHPAADPLSDDQNNGVPTP